MTAPVAKQSQADDYAASAIRHFGAIQQGGVNTPTLCHGLDHLCRAALTLGGVDSPLGPVVRSELLRIAPIASFEVGAWIAPERIYLVLGMASALLSPAQDEFHIERTAHVSLLAADLKAVFLRRWLSGRGDQLARSVVIKHVWATADFSPRVWQ